MILRTGISLNTRHWEIAVSCMTADLTVATNHTRTDGIHVISLRAKKDKSSQYTYSSMLCEIGDSQLRRRRQTRAMQLGLVVRWSVVSIKRTIDFSSYRVCDLHGRNSSVRRSITPVRPSAALYQSSSAALSRDLIAVFFYIGLGGTATNKFSGFFFASNSWKQEAILHC